jgi:hypothetical protein
VPRAHPLVDGASSGRVFVTEILRDKTVQKGTQIGGLHSQEVSRAWSQPFSDRTRAPPGQ